jgi:TetR/AcrR family transcriptional regulator, cholesterol catabolism regulator
VTEKPSGRARRAHSGPDLDTWVGAGDRAKRRRVRPPSARSRAKELRIHRAAAEIFREKGYASTSLQDIADSVGMLKSSLYYYIDGKEDLLFAISQHITGIGKANLQRSLEREGTAEERIVAFLSDHITSFAEAIAWQRVFHAEYQELTGDRYQDVLRSRREYEQHLCDLIDGARAEGIVCPDLDTWLMMTMIFSMVNSIYNWYRPGGRLSLAAVTRNCTQATLGSLACPPSHEHRATKPRLARRTTPPRQPRRTTGRTPR